MTNDIPENEAAASIGTAVLCNELGDPVISELSEDDVWTISQLQDAEEEPMLRDAA
ncbi:hypothetical protein [Arthrobacter caoxuetaonis]|uniref:Uncharacterized protein n=1 Tax=Arthrobacter caoxuetaonis TaxID=2886935 RepID=A0A9X1SDQ8_9MICC|nr:hypothetical protein [Arthrobacter caoxuetaonis]MCC3299443.1 hypothetical protein [Arthrobacter caoxuetaonis]USQ59065.1 hypothetical protein NF551_18335 [Arthrobacter caoxuetaonis]